MSKKMDNVKLQNAVRRGIPLLIIFVLIVGIFSWYTTQNGRRIEKQNLTYASDSAQQTKKRVESELNNALNRINTYAYFLGEGLTSPDVTAEMLAAMEENSLFDAFRFANLQGESLSADGQVVKSTEQSYYQKGFRGDSGIASAFKSEFSDEIMIGFYAPVRYKGEIIGVLRGVYTAEKYLRDMISAQYFGTEAGVYLCSRDGTIIASSGSTIYSGELIDVLLAEGIIDVDAAEKCQELISSDRDGGFTCSADSQTDNICVANVFGGEYTLVQTFPKDITQAMTKNANFAGTVLEIFLILMFFLYILYLLLDNLRKRRVLESENRDQRYVIDSVGTIFSRFALVDFENDTYRYLAQTTPESEEISRQGEYEQLMNYLCGMLAKDEDKEVFRNCLDKNVIIENLGADINELRYEAQILRNGRLEWEHMNIACVERRDGKAAKVVVMRQNITEIKEKELKIQAQIALANRKERQFMTAVTADANCTYEFNLTRDLIEQDIFRTENGKTENLLERVGLHKPCKASDFFEAWKQFVLEESMADYEAVIDSEYLNQKFLEGEKDVTLDYWKYNSIGEKSCVRQFFYMTRDDITSDIMVMVVVKEITGQVKRQMEQTQALQDALMEAQHANNAKTTFLSNMSHDIRTPMNAIIGFTTIAINHIDNREQVRNCLHKVLSSSNHLLSLINDILDMSRIESGKVQILEQECNISEIMHNLVNIIQPQVKAKQLDMYINTFDISNEDVITDSLKMSQIFVNLMSNAVKYTPAGGTVSLSIKQKPSIRSGYGEYVFSVKDNGIGMSQEFVDHIFEPFERESSATKSGIQGTGLGMAITKNIIDMMGGTISVSSEKGQGSEFIVELSLRLQDGDDHSKEIQELVGERALVVDDDPDICSNVSKMLKDIGMLAEWTTSGREAAYRAKAAYEEDDPYHT